MKGEQKCSVAVIPSAFVCRLATGNCILAHLYGDMRETAATLANPRALPAVGAKKTPPLPGLWSWPGFIASLLGECRRPALGGSRLTQNLCFFEQTPSLATL
jgi:hypothetical protein